MAEITNKSRKDSEQPQASETVRIEKGAVEADAVEIPGFSPAEIVRLRRVKKEIASGRYSDITPEHRKLLFVQWLIDHEKIKS